MRPSQYYGAGHHASSRRGTTWAAATTKEQRGSALRENNRQWCRSTAFYLETPKACEHKGRRLSLIMPFWLCSRTGCRHSRHTTNNSGHLRYVVGATATLFRRCHPDRSSVHTQFILSSRAPVLADRAPLPHADRCCHLWGAPTNQCSAGPLSAKHVSPRNALRFGIAGICFQRFPQPAPLKNGGPLSASDATLHKTRHNASSQHPEYPEAVGCDRLMVPHFAQ